MSDQDEKNDKEKKPPGPPEWVTMPPPKDPLQWPPPWRNLKEEDLKGLPEWDDLSTVMREALTVTYALWLAPKYGLPGEEPERVMRMMGVPWEDVLRHIPVFEHKMLEEERGVGRPRKSVEEKTLHPATKQVMYAVRDYLMENPGTATAGPTGERHVYSADFKAFVMKLVGPGGPGEDMTLEQAEYATGVSHHTLTAWRQAMRGREPPPES